MTKFPWRIRFAVGVSALLRSVLLFGLLACVALASPGSAQQRGADTAVNPTASSVKEEQLLREMRIISGRGTIPDTKSYNIEQPRGRDWRQFHEATLPWIGALAILGMFAVLIVFYLIRGMVRIEAGRSGRTLVRFNAFERFAGPCEHSRWQIQLATVPGHHRVEPVKLQGPFDFAEAYVVAWLDPDGVGPGGLNSRFLLKRVHLLVLPRFLIEAPGAFW